MRKAELIKVVITGLIIGILFILIMLVTGQTFGQRCAKLYKENSVEWHDCVDSLSTKDN